MIGVVSLKEHLHMYAERCSDTLRLLHRTWFSVNSFVAFTLFGAANFAPRKQGVHFQFRSAVAQGAAEACTPFFVTALPLPCLFAALFFFDSPFFNFRCCCGIANGRAPLGLVSLRLQALGNWCADGHGYSGPKKIWYTSPFSL